MKNPKPVKKYRVIIIGDKKKLTEALSQIWAETVIEKAKQEGEREP